MAYFQEGFTDAGKTARKHHVLAVSRSNLKMVITYFSD
jgi:hypothetical protein